MTEHNSLLFVYLGGDISALGRFSNYTSIIISVENTQSASCSFCDEGSNG